MTKRCSLKTFCFLLLKIKFNSFLLLNMFFKEQKNVLKNSFKTDPEFFLLYDGA